MSAKLSAREVLDRSITEKEWQATIVEAARAHGWDVYHTFDSRRSQPGFPDLVLCRPPVLMFLECKRQTGSLSEDQHHWFERLSRCVDDTYVVRPSDWEWLKAKLA